MTAPATFTNAKPSEADSLILRATHLIDRLRGHAERNRFDAVSYTHLTLPTILRV